MLFGLDNIEEICRLTYKKETVLLSNSAAINSGRINIIDILKNKINIKAILTPEHGWHIDKAEGRGDKTEFDINKIPVVSIYDSDTIDKIDADIFIYDLPDTGVRYYTYIYNIYRLLKKNKNIVVLDRPPLVKLDVDGNIPDKEMIPDTVCTVPGTIKYGLTTGETAFFVKDYYQLFGKIDIVRMKNFERYKKTEFNFLPPSPAIPDRFTAELYAGTCLFEGTNIDVGRGSDKPFCYIGTDEFDITNSELFSKYNYLKSIEYYSKRKNTYMKGIDFTDFPVYNKSSIEVCIDIISILIKEQKRFNITEFFDRLLGDKNIRLKLDKGVSGEEIYIQMTEKTEEYKKYIKRYYLYD